MVVKYNTIQELAQIVSEAISFNSYTDLIVDTDAIDEDLLFIHHNSFTSTFGVDLEDMTLIITKNDQVLEVIPFTFQTLLEKLREYYAK